MWERGVVAAWHGDVRLETWLAGDLLDLNRILRRGKGGRFVARGGGEDGWVSAATLLLPFSEREAKG